MDRKKNLADHYKNPRNFGVLEKPTQSGDSVYSACGDRVSITLICVDNIIQDVRFQGEGCMICIAAASLVTEHVKNMSCDQVKRITKDDLKNLLGIPIGPVRMQCAMVCLDALRQALGI